MKFSTEAAFLLLSTKPHATRYPVEEVRAQVASGLDWPSLLSLAIPHGLLPLLASNLRRHAEDLLSTETLMQLTAYSMRVAKRNERQTQELLNILFLLSGESIAVLPFKGPVLAVVAYGSVDLRESHDLDFWLSRDHLADAGEILRSAGYQAVGHVQGVPHILKRDGGKQQTEFQHKESGILIELHDELQSSQFSFMPEFDSAWQRREEVLLREVPVPTLEAGDLLMALAVHGSKHMWRRLNWVTDIVGVVENSPLIDWPDLLERARSLHCERRLVSAVVLAERLYPHSMPASYRKSQDRRRMDSPDQLCSYIMKGSDVRTITNCAFELMHHVKNGDTTQDRIKMGEDFMRKLLSVDEARMHRTMAPGTRVLYRLFSMTRIWFGKISSGFAKAG